MEIKSSKQIEEMSLREFVFFLNSLTTTELYKQFPGEFHVLKASDSVHESVDKVVAKRTLVEGVPELAYHGGMDLSRHYLYL